MRIELRRITRYCTLFPLVLCLLYLLLTEIVTSSEKNIQKQKGIVAYVEGTTKKQKDGGDTWMIAKENTDVISGDKVKTYRRSRAELKLAKLDVVRLAPLTTLEINKLYEESKEKILETDLKVTEGSIWAQIGTVKDSATFSLSTPIAGAAIRGTIFRLDVDKDNSTELRVYKGSVDITNAPGNKDLVRKSITSERIEAPHEVPGPHEISFEEWVYTVKEMQKIKIDPRGLVKYAQAFNETDSDEQSDWILWNKKRDKDSTRK